MTLGKRQKCVMALVPIGVLVGFLALDIAIFGADSILGASQVALLGAAGVCVLISTLAYAPFCFFNIISPLMSVIVAAIGYRIVKK